MAWTELTRTQHERESRRYPSDFTPEESAIVRPLLPDGNCLGRPRKVKLRRVWNAIQCIAASGCAWSLLPKDFPPDSTVRCYFYRWRDDGLLAEINRKLVAAPRHAAGRHVGPTAGVIDSQSVKTSENTSLSGDDAGKRIKGRKCHIITDTFGNLIACRVDIYCPKRLRAIVEGLAPGPRHVVAKSDSAPRSYDSIEKSFRAWRATLDDRAKKHDDDAAKYSLHGLRKRACVELAEAGCSDSEIQAVTGQSLETVAKYRKEANRKKLSRAAQLRRSE